MNQVLDKVLHANLQKVNKQDYIIAPNLPFSSKKYLFVARKKRSSLEKNAQTSIKTNANVM